MTPILANLKLNRGRSYLLLALFGLIIYFNSFSNSFVWDDEFLILNNGYIRSPDEIFKILSVDLYHSTVGSDFYRPLFALSLALDYRFWQFNPLGYHLTNFFLHLANSLLILFFLNFLKLNLRVAFVASFLFLLHPIHTQAVTYVSGRADPLALLFILLTTIFFAKSEIGNGRNKVFFYIYSIFFFAAGLLSKEIVLILPFILILYDFCFLYPEKKHSFIQGIKRHLVFLLLAVLYIVLRNYFLPPSLDSKIPHSLFIRLINLPKIISFYLYLLLFPFDLRIERFFPMSVNLDFFAFFLFLFLIFMIWQIIKSFKVSRPVFFFSFWFLISLLPVSNIFLPLNAVVAEHWLYAPSVGFFAIAAIGLDNLIFIRKTVIFRHLLSAQFKKACLIILFFTLSLLTISRNFQWNNAITLFESTLKSSLSYPPFKNVRLRYNLAIAYYRNGRYREAIEQYRQIIRFDPDFEEAHYNLAVAYLENGLYDKAEEEALKAIEIAENYLPPYYVLGIIYKKEGDIGKAKEFWQKMLKIKTDCRLCCLFRERVKSFVTP